MSPLLSYFLQGSFVTAIFLLFYKLLLRRDTFFKWSRWYFVTATAASFLFPLIDVSTLFSATAAPQVILYIPDLSFSAVPLSSNPWETFINSLLYAGMMVMAIRLLMQMAALVKLRKNKRINQVESVRIVELKEQVNPFSFFNEIYVNPCLHTEAELEEIIRHEQFHIQQKHTIDILLSEFLIIVFWFNPFAWVLKNELKQNLEFLTDKLVLATGIDAKHYQYNLLKVSGLQNNIAAANHFHFLKLKNRIMMMNKQQTHPYHAIKFLLLVPIVALLLLAFTERKELIAALQEPMQADTTPPPPKPPVVDDEVTIKQSLSSDGEYQLPKNVKQVQVSTKNGYKKVTVTLNDGTKEVYDLNNSKDTERLEQKYGSVADLLPPPPPPPAPISVVAHVSVQAPASPADVAEAPTPPGSPDMALSPKAYSIHQRSEVPVNEKGYYLSIADDNGECVVIVKDKNKKIIEAILLTDWNKKESFYENKYGSIPPVNNPAIVTVVSPNTDASKNGPGNPYVGNIEYGMFEYKNGTAPLFVIDEIKMPKGFDVNSIEVTNIESIKALKDKSATSIYGDEGNEGVILITTKKNKSSSTITIQSPIFPVNASYDPIFVLEGKVITKEEMNKLDPNKIQSVYVLKTDEAITAYGEKAKNGVVKITLKK